jgi:uncharacterized tellurite resistance protein B-like protein
MTRNYQLALLYLTKLLIDADGKTDEKELEALRRIHQKENISEERYREFVSALNGARERDIYNDGIALIQQCSREEKLQIFATLYRLSEVDGRVHVKEIKLLLFSIKSAEVEFDDVVEFAKSHSF